MSSLDLTADDLMKIATHLDQLGKSTLDVEMIRVAGYRIRLKSTLIEGQRDMVRSYSVVSLAKESDRPPGGVLR